MKIEPNKLRKHILDMVFEKQSGHIGGSFSLCEVISYLYNEHNLIEDNRDKLILSKGHAAPVLYAALYELGLISGLYSFREINSQLQGHPDKNRLKYLHATTGSLGQGLSIAIGHALANKIKKNNNSIFCILGDGEMQEGQIWEALMLAPHYKLDNLFCFVDYNKLQSDGEIMFLGNLEEKIYSFGWNVFSVDGHNINEISDAVKSVKKNIPTFIVLNTIKGKGVSFMENNSDWHSKCPNQEEYKKALKEIGYE
jgi:transketolase